MIPCMCMQHDSHDKIPCVCVCCSGRPIDPDQASTSKEQPAETVFQVVDPMGHIMIRKTWKDVSVSHMP